MKINNLKGRILKCISNCTGFQIDEQEAVSIKVVYSKPTDYFEDY